MGRPSKQQLEMDRLKMIIARQDDSVEQARDELQDLRDKVEFYRKQTNHYLALINILAKGV